MDRKDTSMCNINFNNFSLDLYINSLALVVDVKGKLVYNMMY